MSELVQKKKKNGLQLAIFNVSKILTWLQGLGE